MSLYKKSLSFILSAAMFIGTSSSVIAHEGVSERRIEVCDSAYSIIYTDTEYFIMDFDGMPIKENKANMIEEMFEFRDETYLVNYMDTSDDGYKQLWKINIGYYGEEKEKEDFEILYDGCYDIFVTFTKGIVRVYKGEGNNYKLNYSLKEDYGTIEINMDGFKEYGSFENLKEIDIRKNGVYFLTIAGELVFYDFQEKNFEQVTDKFVYRIRKEIPGEENFNKY